jgi:exopolysaccharide biosynthesis protein
MEKQKSKNKGIKRILFILAIPVQVFAAAVICCMLVFYGPFNTVRKYVVSTAMATYSHQYIAKIFLSGQQIKAILGNDVIKADPQKVTDVSVQNVNSKSIDQYEIKGKQFHGYLLEVSDPARVKVGYTKHLEKVGEITSEIAKDHDAFAAINGGGFAGGASWTGTGDRPTDFLISEGKLIWKDPDLSEYTNCDVIALDNEGKLIVGKHSIHYLQEMNVDDAVTMPGYTPIVVNGKGTYNSNNGGGSGMNPRTAIGQKKDGTILLLVLDGRQFKLPGATTYDVQKIMLDNDAYTAAMLDGGSSSTMYYNERIINNPSSSFGERTVATAFYVTK